MLKNSHYCRINLNFKKVKRALENVFAGTFLPPGSGLATPDLDGQKELSIGWPTLKNYQRFKILLKMSALFEIDRVYN